ncbi:MAG: Asp-tRNA(Asn)/Glu-tRNA(Gln) amidotransferase subunit GatC [Phycisphaeraceae bacterium]|nr:Asp-tRNA(Asn)/Glu-tRNA(Gln) amidotransferase subunit GatC [Phycisphaeraceae bacterium]
MPEKLTDDQVRHVAKLSRLRLGEDEVSQMASRLSAVLDYVSKLNELNVDGVEPMAHAMELNNVLREDEPRAGLPNDAVLANAPEKTPPFFRVPKVIGDGGGA